MDPVTVLKLYFIGLLLFYGYSIKFTSGQTYSFEPVTWTEARNRCMLADQETVCDPNSRFCEAKTTISDTSLIDNVRTWIGGFYYRSLWIVNIGCFYMLDSDLDRLATRHNLSSINNADNCAVRCGNSSFYGLAENECYCIDGYKAYLANVPSSFCDTPCPGNPSESCGSPRVNLKFLTVYETIQDQSGPSSEEVENCAAIYYTSNSTYQIVSKNCTERLSFSCRPLSVAPKFYNYGNMTWNEAAQYCSDLGYYLTDAFYIDFTNSDSLELNTYYWIGRFRVEKNYWDQDLPTYGEDDPQPECLSINNNGGSYSVQKHDCTTSLSALCLQQISETSTSEQTTTNSQTTESSTETSSTASTTMSTVEETTSATPETSTGATLSSSSTSDPTTSMEPTSTSSVSTTMSKSTTASTTSEMTSSTMPSTTMSSSSTSATTQPSAESTSQNTMSSSTVQATSTTSTTETSAETSTTTSATTVTSTVSTSTTEEPPVIPGQTGQQTASAGVYVGVPLGLILGIIGVILLAFFIMRLKKNNRRFVYRMEGPQRTSNPILDLDDYQGHERGKNAMSRRSTYKRHDPDGGENKENTNEMDKRMTTGPLTEPGCNSIVDLETSDGNEAMVTQNQDQIYQKAKPLSFIQNETQTDNSSDHRQSNGDNDYELAINIVDDHGDRVVSTENLIQSEEEEEIDETQEELDNNGDLSTSGKQEELDKDGSMSGIVNEGFVDDDDDDE